MTTPELEDFARTSVALTKPVLSVICSLLVVHRVPDDRARHAMTAAATASQLRADNGDHLNAFLAQQRVGIGVAVVGVHDAWRRTNEVGTTVPLRPLALIVASARLDDTKFLETQRFLDDADKWLRFRAQFYAARVIARAVGVGPF